MLHVSATSDMTAQEFSQLESQIFQQRHQFMWETTSGDHKQSIKTLEKKIPSQLRWNTMKW